MAEEPYEHRPHDHLVEPFFGGVGVGSEEPRQGARDPWFVRILSWLGLRRG